MNALLLNLMVIYLPLFFIGLLMPSFTKKTLLFGIVIPEEVSHTEEVLKIKETYRRNYVVSTLLIGILINGIFIKTGSEYLIALGTFLLVANMSLNYFYVHRKAKNLKEEKGWTSNKKQVVIVDTSHYQNLKYMSPHWFWLPVSIVIFTLVLTIVKYPNVPDQVPIHFDLSGNITNYSPKSLWNVFALPFTQIGMTLLLFFVYRVIQRSKPSIQASRPKTSAIQNQIAKGYWAIYSLVIAVIINLQFCFIQLNVLQLIPPRARINLVINILATILPIAGVIIVAMKTGQSGSRIKVDYKEEVNSDVIDRDDDRFWKWGMFYYNPDDPSIFVEKRFGIGWTINFGRTAGVAIMAILLIFIVVSILLDFL